MNENTKTLLVKPLIIQEIIIISILTPIVLFFFRYISSSVLKNFTPVLACASLAANLGLFLGIMTKYSLVSPALRLMEKKDYSPEELQHASRSLAILPMAEAVVTALRFGFFGNLIAPVALYLKGYILFSEALFAGNAVIMMGLLAAPNVYLASENSLSTFFVSHNLKPVMDSDLKLFRFSLSKKTLTTMFFIAVPPLCLILGLIYLSMYTKLDIISLKTGFHVILLETIFLIFISGTLLMKNIAISVERMQFMFKDMAKGQGDLTRRIDVTGLNEMGELAFWFNEFIDDIEEIVEQVRGIALSLHQSIEDVSRGSLGLCQTTQEQASTVQEVTSSIDEMNETIRSNTELVIEGRETSNTVTRLMVQNRQVFEELMRAIQEISQDSQRIGDIVSTVNEVAFHTNLLALNASVEAARAGDHGKGFAVVAGEVRSLAQRSAQASGEIKALIEGTVGRIMNGDTMMKKTRDSLEDLMGRLESFFSMMDVIGNSSLEQSQNISEINRSMSQIDGSVQESASTAEELSRTMENLNAMARKLTENVSKFKTSKARQNHHN
jgi:methyl-accepting chemotaxis protein